MPNYLFRPDRGPVERFDAVSDAAARDYVKELLLDEGADEGDGGGLYRTDDGGRGDEEYLGEARLGVQGHRLDRDRLSIVIDQGPCAPWKADEGRLHAGGPDALFAGKEQVIDEVFEALERVMPKVA